MMQWRGSSIRIGYTNLVQLYRKEQQDSGHTAGGGVTDKVWEYIGGMDARTARGNVAPNTERQTPFAARAEADVLSHTSRI